MRTKNLYAIHILMVVALAWGLGYSRARGQEGTPPAPQAPEAAVSAFTYQGALNQSGSPVNATCDFKFGLWTAQSAGSQLGVTQTLTSTVSSGLFSVKLNGASQFGAMAFDGNRRWLAAAVRCPTNSGSYASLTPQELNATPYALFSLNADSTAKLQGIPVSSAAPTTGQMLKYNGSQWAAGGYQGLVIVAKSGGNYTTIHQALNSISDASDTNRYLVKVMPGVYMERVTMKPYVDIEGSGEQTTRITSPASCLAGTCYPTLAGVDNAELRFLTVESTGGAAKSIAIDNVAASPRLARITVKASGGSGYNYGVFNISASSAVMIDITVSAIGGTYTFGVYNSGSSPTMTNVTASALGISPATIDSYGVYNSSSSPVMNNVTANASGGSYSYGVYNSASSPTMTHVTASAVGTLSPAATYEYGVYNDASAPAMMDTTASASGGIHNYGVVNKTSPSTMVMTNVTASATGGQESDNYAVYNSTASPAMTNVIANALGGIYSDNFGILNWYASSPVMKNVVISVSGGYRKGSTNDGVWNSDGSSPIMTGVTISVSGPNSPGSVIYGVRNQFSAPTMTNVTVSASTSETVIGVDNEYSAPLIQNSAISASSGGYTFGIYNTAQSGAYIVTVNNSQVAGATNAIKSDSHFTTYVGASSLAGGPVQGGATTCAGVYDENYVFYPSACP